MMTTSREREKFFSLMSYLPVGGHKPAIELQAR